MKPSSNHSRDFRIFLQEELVRRAGQRPGYSLRAFASSLGTDFSSLAKLLRGKRPLGRLTITRLGQKLGLAPDELAEFLEFHQKRSPALAPTAGGDSVASGYQQLTLDSFRIISDWYHFAILELMRLETFQPKIRWVSRTLGITETEARAALERLQRAGMIEISAHGAWIDRTGGTSTTVGNPFTDAAFRKLQRQVLEKALHALENTPLSRRDQTSMTMAIDSRRLPEAKERIKKFRRELDSFLSGGPHLDQVYNLNVSLYPLTQIKKEFLS